MSISSSTGTPVRSASSAKVTPLSAENRSKAGSSRKSSETWPLADGGAQAVEGDARRRQAADHPDAAHVALR